MGYHQKKINLKNLFQKSNNSYMTRVKLSLEDIVRNVFENKRKTSRECADFEAKEVVDNINEEKLKDACYGYILNPFPITYDNPLSLVMNSDRLCEGLITTYPLDKAITMIKDYFRLFDGMIKKEKCRNGEERISVSVFTTEDLLSKMKRAMSTFGYFLSSPKEENIKMNNWNTLKFEKKFQENVNEKLRSEEKILYHLSPRYKKDNILKCGLSPRSKNSLFSYPNRLYLIRGSVDEETIKKTAWMLEYYNNSKGNKDFYTLFTINLNLIPNDVAFYNDPNFTDGVYTTEYIKPNAIIDAKDFAL